ncbi:hypothetical protein MGA5115_00062 [Marinomonas gallaica]|uniref:Uncharacterized protein n=1 Tax=Marinomonas gallaica TaxID=1806667 RepID=A0A1C3JL96_9GAMM|nr:hypothetical protein MGA5115_00062 [Marinomonas gallaica]SBT21036.1 hypothetical protein MGA5116_01623 [Marinomonas gallaica]
MVVIDSPNHLNVESYYSAMGGHSNRPDHYLDRKHSKPRLDENHSHGKGELSMAC